MIKDKAKVKGTVKAQVISLDAEGICKLTELQSRYPDKKERKRDPKYLAERDRIYAEHGFRKRRETWDLNMLWSSIWATRFNLKDIYNVLRYEMAINHNIVTDEGDALIADIMSETPARTKVDNTNGHIEVGTGWTGVSPKTNTSCNTPTGSPEIMDATYPKLKGSFGAADDNVTQYRATYDVGDLNASGIDEAALINGSVAATSDCLAYGQITPSVNVALTDTLQVDWEITYLGA